MYRFSSQGARVLPASAVPILVAAAVAWSTAPAAAQRLGRFSDDQSGVPAPPRKSPLVAAALQAAFPPLPLGYLYAGDVQRGLLPTGLMVGGSTLFILQVIDWATWEDPPSGPALAYVGLGAMMAGYVWGVFGAAATARDANTRAGPALAELWVSPSPGGIAAGLTVFVP